MGFAPGAWANPASPEPVQWPAVRLLDGSAWAPAEGRAQVVVFWSVSCPFCLRHNAHIEQLHQAVQDGQGPQVLTVCQDRDVQSVRRYLSRHRYTFAVTLDHAALAPVLATRRVIPLTVLVDRQGRRRMVIPGEMFPEDVMQLKLL